MKEEEKLSPETSSVHGKQRVTLTTVILYVQLRVKSLNVRAFIFEGCRNDPPIYIYIYIYIYVYKLTNVSVGRCVANNSLSVVERSLLVRSSTFTQDAPEHSVDPSAELTDRRKHSDNQGSCQTIMCWTERGEGVFGAPSALTASM
jgi:hypothetical protein